MICHPISIRGLYGRGFLLNVLGTPEEIQTLAEQVQALGHTFAPTMPMPDRPFASALDVLQLVREE